MAIGNEIKINTIGSSETIYVFWSAIYDCLHFLKQKHKENRHKKQSLKRLKQLVPFYLYRWYVEA